MRPGSRQEDAGFGIFVMGAIVGAAVALLLAPESGTDSRARMGHWLHEHSGSPHDLLVKIKKMLIRHNGVHAVNGRTSGRRHRGGAV
jgi:gas vesicle protein